MFSSLDSLDNFSLEKPNRTIYLLGASGFVGNYVYQKFKSSGENIVILDTRAKINSYASDLQRSSISVNDVCVVTAAAGVNTKQLTTQEYEFNSEKLPLVVNNLHSLGISKFIYLGSCFEYGTTGNTSHYLSTDSKLEPIEDYGKSKRDGYERLIDWAQKQDTSFSYLRLFQLFGENEASHRLYQGLIHAATTNINYVVKDPFAIRDFCRVQDVADAIVRHSLNLHGVETLNVCSGVGTSLIDFSKYVFNTMNANSSVISAETELLGSYRRLVGKPNIKIPQLM